MSVSKEVVSFAGRLYLLKKERIRVKLERDLVRLLRRKGFIELDFAWMLYGQLGVRMNKQRRGVTPPAGQLISSV